MTDLEKYLDELPSRIYSTVNAVFDKAHYTHQLVIEKFPDHTWSATYVCLGCKGKTVQYISPNLNIAVMQLDQWVKLNLSINKFRLNEN